MKDVKDVVWAYHDLEASLELEGIQVVVHAYEVFTIHAAFNLEVHAVDTCSGHLFYALPHILANKDVLPQ